MADEAAIGQDAIERSAMRKAMWRIVPLLGLGYLISYIDRVNVSFAAAEMNADLGFSAAVYGLGSGLFFLSYALFEIPSGMMVARFGPRLWIARIMISWGLLASAMMFVRTPMHFYAMRFVLGMAEAGFFPCSLYCVSHWFPNAHRGRATGRFYAFGGLAGVSMGILSAWLLQLDGLAGLHGWQWLYLVQGLPAVILGVVVLFALPDRPAKARFLTDEERDWIEGTLAREAAQAGESADDHNLLRAARDWGVLQLAIIGCLTTGSYLSFQMFVPQVLAAATGFDPIHVGYVYSFAGLFIIIGMVGAGWQSDRRRERFGPLFLGCLLVAIALTVLALATTPVVAIIAFCSISLVWPLVVVATNVISTEIVPRRMVGVAAGTVNMLSQMGAFVGPWLIGLSKDATGSYHLAQTVLPVGFLLAIAVGLSLRRHVRGKVAG